MKECSPSTEKPEFDKKGGRVSHDVKYVDDSWVRSQLLTKEGCLPNTCKDEKTFKWFAVVRVKASSTATGPPQKKQKVSQSKSTKVAEKTNSSDKTVPAVATVAKIADSVPVTNLHAEQSIEVGDKTWTFGTRDKGPDDKLKYTKWTMRYGTEQIRTGNGKERPFFAYFRQAFPWNYFATIVRLTNIALKAANLDLTSIGDLVTFIGIMLVMTQVEFNSRNDCWKTEADPRRCQIPLNFGKRFKMARNRWNDLRKYLTVSDRGDAKPKDHQEANFFRWKIASDFFDAFNSWYAPPLCQPVY